MRHLFVALLLAASAAPALAQTAAPPAPSYDLAPWWMREPIIASTGYVRAEVPANRARFTAEFQAVEHDAQQATRSAAAKVRTLGDELRAYGADKVRVETTFATRPLYEQYRDKDGNLINNVRPDKIERYEVTANVSIELRNVALTERVYAMVLAAGPSSATPVGFSLQPDNETNTQLFKLAVADARRRAGLAVESAGAKLGAVKLIDPTGRACQTDVLVAGAPRPEVEIPAPAQDVAAPMALAAPPPPPPSQASEPQIQLPLQPPLNELTASACVVYALIG